MFKKVTINYSLLAFITFTVKMLILSPTYADSIIVCVLAGLYGYTQYLKKFQPFKLDKAVEQDLLEVKSALSRLNLSRSADKLTNKKYF